MMLHDMAPLHSLFPSSLKRSVYSFQIKSIPQLEAGFAYLSTVGPEPLNEEELSEKSGVGKESFSKNRARVYGFNNFPF